MTKFFFELHFRVQSCDLTVIKNFTSYLQSISKTEGLNFRSINLPIKINKVTVLRSPHVNKRSKDQYEIRAYNRLYIIESKNFITLLNNLMIHPSLSVKISFKNKIC